MARSLNRVQLIGNLTRDPELRYTSSGTAVCSFGVATNRTWTTDTGEKREEADFHKIVAWNKLAELCSQFLVKGRKVYVEGRLSTRNWTGQDGAQRTTTEVVIDDMILLDSRGAGQAVRVDDAQQPTPTQSDPTPKSQPGSDAVSKQKKKTQVNAEDSKQEEETKSGGSQEEEVAPEDIPF